MLCKLLRQEIIACFLAKLAMFFIIYQKLSFLKKKVKKKALSTRSGKCTE